ncbi:hypothetical protein Unana1_00070 [Umbelopsis nana]
MIVNSFLKNEALVAAEKIITALDGKTTEEKETTANLRRQVKEKDFKKMEDLLRKAEEKTKSGKRVSGMQMSDIHRLCRRAFSLTPNMKTALSEAALASS